MNAVICAVRGAFSAALRFDIDERCDLRCTHLRRCFAFWYTPLLVCTGMIVATNQPTTRGVLARTILTAFVSRKLS